MSRLPVDASGCLPATPRSQWLFEQPLQVDTKSNRSALGTLNLMRADTEYMLCHEYANIAEMTGYRIGAC